jgi:hypothetical protein
LLKKLNPRLIPFSKTKRNVRLTSATCYDEDENNKRKKKPGALFSGGNAGVCVCVQGKKYSVRGRGKGNQISKSFSSINLKPKAKNKAVP